MNFLKKITKKEIFQKVAQITNTQTKSKNKSKTYQIYEKNGEQECTSQKSNKLNDKQFYNQYSNEIDDYQSAQKFILNLNENSKAIKKQEIKKKTKQQIFSDLQIDPIYLQHCQFAQLFKMELEFSSSERYERTEILHNYLNQVNQTLKKMLFTQNLEILEVFDIIKRYQDKITEILTKIKLIRESINKKKVQQELKIKKMMTKKQTIKQKLALLIKMKQKSEITLIKPQNIEQIYYTQRSRHKLYNRLKVMSTENNSYLRVLKSQIVSISVNNINVISQCLNKWINSGQKLREKSIEKLFICLYFIKTENIYKQNSIGIDLKKLHRDKFIKQIQIVKSWKNYQYIRDSTMKGKIADFLDTLIKQVRNSN